MTPLTPLRYSDRMTAAVTAESIRQRLADLPEVMPDLRLLVLFGSAARDSARSESDIDLAVQCEYDASDQADLGPQEPGA